MFGVLEKHAKTTANTRMQPKIPSLLIYEVLIDNTLNRAAMFFFGHPYLESITVLSDIHIHIHRCQGNAEVLNSITSVSLQ